MIVFVQVIVEVDVVVEDVGELGCDGIGDVGCVGGVEQCVVNFGGFDLDDGLQFQVVFGGFEVVIVLMFNEQGLVFVVIQWEDQ